MESVLVKYLTTSLYSMLTPLQFAYWSDRGMDDAVLTLVNSVTKQLMHPQGFVRILLVDFSSAFNYMKTHILLRGLSDPNISKFLILWIREFLCHRPLRVCVSGCVSDVLTVSTGCPQGCVYPFPCAFLPLY